MTDNPDWLPPSARVYMDKKAAFKVGVEVHKDTIHIDKAMCDTGRWQAFIEGEHTATMKGDRLIIRKS